MSLELIETLNYKYNSLYKIDLYTNFNSIGNFFEIVRLDILPGFESQSTPSLLCVSFQCLLLFCLSNK
jgi:hypothetical protein